MTTDTVRKEVVVAGAGFTVGGMAKGAAMLAPNMATMLAVLTTDAAAEPDELATILRAGVADSFNAMSVDGCTSTNDTVILLASGRRAAGRPADLRPRRRGRGLPRPGHPDGGRRRGRHQGGAGPGRRRGHRRRGPAGARKVAESQLVKCSWYGEDPYWGRVASELGSAGIAFDPDRVSVVLRRHRGGRRGGSPSTTTTAAWPPHGQERLEVVADLGLGAGDGVRVLTNDLTHAYIDENMGTS